SPGCWPCSPRSPCAACAARPFEPATLRAGRPRAPGELGRGGTRRGSVRLYAPEPDALPVAVVLGLVLRGDRLAALRPGALARRARDASARLSARWVRRPRHLLGPRDLFPAPDRKSTRLNSSD